jgi:hypothetical protein
MPERGSVETRYWSMTPFEGGAVAEAVVEGGGWDAAEGEGFVVAEFGLVFAEGHPFYAEGPGLAGLFDLFEGVLRLLLVVDVEFHEALACVGKGLDVGREGDAGEFALVRITTRNPALLYPSLLLSECAKPE